MKYLLVSALCLTSVALAAEQRLGQPLTVSQPISVGALLEKPAGLVGKTVQVKGKVTEVCDAMGCWMNLTDDANHLVRIQVADGGDIVFPKDSIGKTAIAEGKLEKLVMTREQVIAAAREEAEETHRKFDASKIKSGKTVYQIAGSGAVIFN
jgi:hypothetical protein